MTLRELRIKNELTQKECAAYIGIPLRTYQNYETDHLKAGTMKYEFMMNKLADYGSIDEEHGILTVEKIKELCEKVFFGKDIEFCYLFGSYAKGKATEKSDVDLLVSTSISGLDFFGLVEDLREALNKRVDVLNMEQLRDNYELVKEILRDGVKIYG